MAKKMLKQYEILIKKATVDLNIAKLAMTAFEKGNIELDLEVIMFHLQQSVEKFIKTLLDYNKIKFPHTHDIEELILFANKNNVKIIDNIEYFIHLSDYAVEGRYAIIHDDIDDAEKHIVLLDKLLKFVKSEINPK